MKKRQQQEKHNKYECPVCNRFISEAEDDLILHIVKVHKLNNSLKNDLSIKNLSGTNSSSIKCTKCSKEFQNEDAFFVHIFRNHFNDVLRTIDNSRMRANSEKIKKLFESLRNQEAQHSPALTTVKFDEKIDLPDINYILSIESLGQAQISDQIDSEVQTDGLDHTENRFSTNIDNKIIEQQNDFSNNRKEDNFLISNAAKHIYEINNLDSNKIDFYYNDNSTNIDLNDEDEDDDYLSFIASTIDTTNVRLQNGKLAPSNEEKKKKKVKKTSSSKDEERNFFDRLEQVTDILLLQKVIVNTQTNHKCLRCKMDFENEFMLMKHVWEYHNDDEIFLY
ncbi:hypothetical protein M9Y10_015358 [Tritrichomonas musculus]|uniref:C2H2-type domain-containing protein n=1 Tax=Tritrichomonas musculus TaxID=1915356 RepID=A0ABR2L255_9EUKA